MSYVFPSVCKISLTFIMLFKGAKDVKKGARYGVGEIFSRL
jgi:hypothetical protein